ncbi:hypothetical protein [Archangium lipolyticum]|uniref:hypothetical protein n=1 Tax=Archangium lipolyticum TaxID=2970465 RepID=UPI00214A6B4B|nr:hypothetical protein [Archangium lipolyticum]
MSIESRPPQEAEQQNTAEMIAPTANPPDQAPASVTPTGQPGGRRKMGKSGPPGPARKGRTVARRKPEKKAPAPTSTKRAAAARKNTRAGEASSFREKAGWKTEPKVGGRKPSASQKRGPTKKAGPAQKTLAKRAAGKSPAAKRPTAKTAARRTVAAAKRTVKRATGRR